MDIPLPSDDTSKGRNKPKRNVINKIEPERGDSRSRNSSKREQSQNWNRPRFGSNHDRNENNSGRNYYSKYNDGKMHRPNLSYGNRGANFPAKNEYQMDSDNFQSNLSHEYGSEGYRANISSYHDPSNVQQNSSTFSPCLNTMNSVNTPGFGYDGMNSANQCYDPSGMSNITSSSSMNDIPPNFNYGSSNLNVYNDTSNYNQFNPIGPPVINRPSYSYTDVNSINLPNNLCPVQPPLNFINYNAGVQGVHSSDNTINYSSFSSEGMAATSTNLVIPMPPAPPILPKTFNTTISESVSEVPLPQQPPTLDMMPDNAPPPPCSDVIDDSKNISSLDCTALSQEELFTNEDIKLSNLSDPIFEKSKPIISDIMQNNSSLSETVPSLSEIVSQSDEAENSNNKLSEEQELKTNILDSNCKLGSTIEGNKIENTVSVNETANEASNLKKISLSFPTNIKVGNVEKSFLDSNSPTKKICNFPCLGKEGAKKRLRAFSANKLLVKEKTTKPSRINPLQDDQDDNDNNGPMDRSNDDKKETYNKKKKIPEKTSIAQIKEREEKLKEMLVNNHVLFKDFQKEMNLSNLPGINYFEYSNLDKFEKKTKYLTKYLEDKQEEELKRDCREKRRSSSAGRDRDRRREKKYSRSDNREGRHEESNKVKKSVSSEKKVAKLPKSWNDFKELKLKVEDLCNLFQKNKLNRGRSRSQSPSFETESRNRKSRDERKSQNDPFPFLPRNFKDLQALKREETSPMTKDYNSDRQDYFKKSYRGCNVQHTTAKPTICYNINSERYDYHYFKQKALKYKNSSDIMNIIVKFHNKSFERHNPGMGVCSTKSVMWYPEDWSKATRERHVETEKKYHTSKPKAFDEDDESYGHSCKIASSKDDEQNLKIVESHCDSKLYNEKDKYKINKMTEVDNYDQNIDSDLDMHARFFTEENDVEDEEIGDKDDNNKCEVDKKQHLKEPKESYVKNVGVTDTADNNFGVEQTSKVSLLDEEYNAFISTVDNEAVHKTKHKSLRIIETSFKEQLNIKSCTKELVKEDKTKRLGDEPVHKIYEEVKAKLKSSNLNEEEYKKLKKLKKELKQQKSKVKEINKKMKKKKQKATKKELKDIKKKDKKAKKALQKKTELSKKKNESMDDVSPEQDMSEYEVIEYESYYEENEQRNVGSEIERSETGKEKSSELAGINQSSPGSNLECNNVELLQQKEEVSNSDLEEDRYSPSNISQYSEEGVDVDTSNMAMELSSPIDTSSSLQLDTTDSPSSHPYSPSNMFDEDHYAPSPYSPSSPQSSGSYSPPQSDRSSKIKQETILNSIPIPPSKLDNLPDNFAQLESSDGLSNKNITSVDVKEPSLSGIAVKGFQPVTFKLNLTKQTNAKLLQKPSLAGFDLDEEEEIESTKSPRPIPEIKDLYIPLLASETIEGESLLPQNKAKTEKHIDELIKYNEKDNFNDDNLKTRKREPENKIKRNSLSPRKSSRHRSRSRSRSPKVYRRKSYEKVVSKSPLRKEKSYRDSSPVSSNPYRRKERSRTPENYSRSGNRSPSALEKQRHVRSPSLEKIQDVYEKDVYYNKKSRSRTPSPVTKWKKVKSPPPKKFRQKSSYGHEEEPFSRHPYKKDVPREHYSTTSSRSHSRSRERSPKYETGSKHNEDGIFYTSYDEDSIIRPISSISNQYPRDQDNSWVWESEDNALNEHLYSSNLQSKPSLSPSSSPHRLSLNERLKQEIGQEFGEDNYWEYNTNQAPQQIAGSSRVIRDGNVLRILPQDSSLENVLLTPVAPPEAMQPSMNPQDVVQSTPVMQPKMVQTGNIIQVVTEGMSEQDILVSKSNDQEDALFNSGLVPQIPLPDNPLPLKSMFEKSSVTKVFTEKPSPDRNVYENTLSLNILPEKLSPLPDYISPMKTSLNNISPMQSPVIPVTTSAPVPLPDSNPLAIISSLLSSTLSRKEHNIDGSTVPSYTQILSNQLPSPANLNAPSYSETFAAQENAAIFIQDPRNSSTVELRTANSASPLITSLDTPQHAIFSAAVSAARGDTAGDNALAQLLSVLQQHRMAPATVDNISTQAYIDQPMMPVDLATFKQQKRERKERKQREKEQRQARREKRRLEREKLEQKSKSNLSDDEDDIVMKEAITEVPDLGSPVPEYEVYNDDDDEEDEQEVEKMAKPALVILPPPEKGILISPSYRILNVAKVKSVSFADGVIPGDGTDVSGGEEIHSPPPPNSEPEKKKGKKLTKKKRVKVKPIKQFKFGNSRMDSPPPPPPAIPPDGNVIKLYQGCSYASCTGPDTYVVYTQRPMEANVDGGANIIGQVTIPPGMLFHAAAFSRAFPPVEGIMSTFASYSQVMESPIMPI